MSTLGYGRGEVQGDLYTDDVVAGGFKVSECWLLVGARTGNRGACQ
jgi:hypothetical protein